MIPKKTRGPKKRGLTAAQPGFKSQRQSSSAAPFPAPPTIGHRCQHSGRCGPVTWSRLSPSSSGPHYKSLFGAPLLAAPYYIPKIKDKERILKAAREKGTVTYKGVPIRLLADFSKEIL